MERVARHIVSVGGGKGGVGKSVVAANLAVAMAQEGHRVVLVDGDLGAANLHTLFGLTQAGPTLQDFVDHQVASLEAARIETGVRRLSLVRGANAVFGAANPSHGSKQRLMRHVAALDADVVVVDVGAGTAFNQLDLFDLADRRLVVLTPQLTSVENAYGFVKAAVFRALSPVLKAHGFDDVLDGPARSEAVKLPGFITEVAACSPKLGAELGETLNGFGLSLFGNLMHEPREAAVFQGVSRMMRDFLSLEVPVLGVARSTSTVHESVNHRRPVLITNPHDDASVSFRRAASALLAAGGATRRAA
jgi:flagellar biosynthesis protein FlhG